MSLRDDPDHPGKHIDSETGIWPIAEWGNECGRGFVSDARFSGGRDRVIKRTNRGKTRKWYELSENEFKVVPAIAYPGAQRKR